MLLVCGSFMANTISTAGVSDALLRARFRVIELSVWALVGAVEFPHLSFARRALRWIGPLVVLNWIPDDSYLYFGSMGADTCVYGL